MVIALATIAVSIFLVYSIYFGKIIKGSPQTFELELLKALADWMINRGSSSKNQLWVMLLVTVVFEAGYFLLVFTLINNMVMQFLSGFVAGAEIFHLVVAAINFHRFFQGKIVLKDIFNWYIERISAVLLFTHSLLVLAVIIFF
ncbi:MAG: hypothetical protein ABFC94_14820 [Syntrophomonas sp.]